MNVADLQAQGIELRLVGDRLLVRGDFTDELLVEIERCKPELKAELEPRCRTCGHWLATQPIGWCSRNKFETHGSDNCKRHTAWPA